MESAWEPLRAAIAEAPYPTEVLPAAPGEGERCVAALGIGETSVLGMVVRYTGGLLIDHGWLRVIGSGTPGLPDILHHASDAIVAFDVLGGQFSWVPSEPGTESTIHYFAPDTLLSEDLGVSYSHWLSAMLSGGMTEFYATMRWPGWEDEVSALSLEEGISTYPPQWSDESKDLSAVSRKAVPIAELASALRDAAKPGE